MKLGILSWEQSWHRDLSEQVNVGWLHFMLASPVYIYIFEFFSGFLFFIVLLVDRSKFCGDTETVPIRTVNRQCSSGLQAVADVAAAIKAGFYDIGKRNLCFWKYFIIFLYNATLYLFFLTIHIVFLLITTCNVGIGAGLESMTTNPMSWEGSVNPRVLYLTPFACFHLFVILPIANKIHE